MFSEETTEISDFLFLHGPKESNFHPIDRFFLAPFVQQIIRLNRNEFIIYNLERGYNTYTTYLFLCLPELWEDITYEDLLSIIKGCTVEASYVCLIYFTFKYVEINGLKLVLDFNGLTIRLRNNILSYVRRVYMEFIKDETDYLFLGEGGMGIFNEDWIRIKQKLLEDNRFEEAPQNQYILETYIKTLK